MKREQTELVDFIINPTFLERIKQPLNTVAVALYHSFKIERSGHIYHITFYTGKEGQVCISSYGEHGIGNTILRDYCKTMDDFEKMIEKLDDLSERFPIWPIK